MKAESLRIKNQSNNIKSLIILTVVIWAFFTLYYLSKAYISYSNYTGNIIEVSDPEKLRDSIPRDGLSILYFKQKNCPGCAKLEPALLRYVNERADIKLIVANIDNMLERNAMRTLEILGDYRVPGTPTIIVYVNGVEVGRHVSTFGLGEQYEPLKKFIEDAILRRVGESIDGGLYSGIQLSEDIEKTLDLGYIITSTITSYILGLIAALSPCSLPMISAYALSSARGSIRFSKLVKKALTLWSVATIGGSLMVILYVSSHILTISIYNLVLSLAASMLVAWGLLTIITMNPMIIMSQRLSKITPLLGVHCSLPFLISLIAMLKAAPHIILLGTLAFTLGYITPYIAVLSTVELANTLRNFMTNKFTVIIQGIIIASAGIYTLYYLL
ncbi:MAG: thioredoxin fold domain-containing protein [Acidilobaceae archaeon]